MNVPQSPLSPPGVVAVFLVFLRIGALGFGGPMALIALIERECRERLQWVSLERFNEAVLFCKLLPGPVAYQVALWIGRDVRGLKGALAAGLGFLLPGFCLMLLLAVFYQALAGGIWVESFLVGVRSAAVVVILTSLWGLAAPYRHRAGAWIFALFGAGWMAVLPRWEPVAILAGGFWAVYWQARRSRRGRGGLYSVEPVSLALLLTVFWVHFKAGAFVYGTGVAILPFLQQEAVSLQKWMGQGEFLDAIALAQATPGPLTIVSTFIGFRAAEWWGSVFSTVGMYLPGLVFVLVFLPWAYPRIRGLQGLVHFQQGALPVVIGGILGAWALLLPEAVATWTGAVLTTVLMGWVSVFPRAPAWAVVLGGGFLGIGVQAVWP